MARFLDPYTIARTFRDPVTWGALVIDLIPIYAVFVLGWGAAPLVFLYWLENLVIGVITLARMIVASMREHPLGITGMVFFGPFFVVHYGLFCFVHGSLLVDFQVSSASAGGSGSPFMNPLGLIEYTLASGPQMPLFVLLIAAWQGFLFVYDFLLKGEFQHTDIGKEMIGPYGRIMVLHVALFAGAFALFHFGEPMVGVLALIVLRAVWGIVLSVRRRLRLDQKLTPRHKSAQGGST